MNEPDNIRIVSGWWQTPTGLGLSAATRRALVPWLERLRPRRVLQLGMPGLWEDTLPVAAPWFVSDPAWSALAAMQVPCVRAAADPGALPFAADSFDLVLLPYVLERSDDPGRVLSECYRVLQPEGYLLVLAFNPHSLFSLMRRWQLWRHNARWPWRQPFLPAGQVRRLLSEQDFEVRAGRFFQYRLPLLPLRWQSHRQWLEFMGDRWWPTGANAYMLLAQRREPGWIPPALLWRRYAPAMPATEGLQRGAVKGFCRVWQDEDEEQGTGGRRVAQRG